MKSFENLLICIFLSLLTACGGGSGSTGGGSGSSSSAGEVVPAGTVSLVANLNATNASLAGLALSPDGLSVYVADSGGGGVLHQIDLASGGTTSSSGIAGYSPYWITFLNNTLYSSWGIAGSLAQTKFVASSLALANFQITDLGFTINGLTTDNVTIYSAAYISSQEYYIAEFTNGWTNADAQNCYGTGMSRAITYSNGYLYTVSNSGIQVCKNQILVNPSGTSAPSNPRGMVVNPTSDPNIDMLYIVSYDGFIEKYQIDHTNQMPVSVSDLGPINVNWSSSLSGFCKPFGLASDSQYLYVSNSTDPSCAASTKNTVIKIKL
jgi:hypothetical protein